ncbi:hypothetical protein ACVWY2_008797 [Bradyrhizobium sp. JR6.1]
MQQFRPPGSDIVQNRKMAQRRRDSNLGLCFVSASCRSKICARRYAYPAQPPERARFDALFEIERAINGRGADERRAVRQEKSKPLLKDMHAWLLREPSRAPPRS